MQRFLVILFAVLMPLQSALAAVVSVAGMPGVGCEQMRASHARGTAAMPANMVSECGCMNASGGTHGTFGHHACPHLGMAVVAITCSELPTMPSFNSAPDTEPASFDSIVLGVPSPPPTSLA